jgi:protein-arginine kinase activator protein McsA
MPSSKPSDDARPPKASPSTPDRRPDDATGLAPLVARALGIGPDVAPGTCSCCGGTTNLVRISDDQTEALVCLGCMASQGNDRLRLSARFMAALAMPLPHAAPPVPPALDEALACPACGVTFGQVMASGLLGCAACYDAFREAVEAGLARLQSSP